MTWDGNALVEATETYLPAFRYTPQPNSRAIRLSTLLIIENIGTLNEAAIWRAWIRSAVSPDWETAQIPGWNIWKSYYVISDASMGITEFNEPSFLNMKDEN